MRRSSRLTPCAVCRHRFGDRGEPPALSAVSEAGDIFTVDSNSTPPRWSGRPGRARAARCEGRRESPWRWGAAPREGPWRRLPARLLPAAVRLGGPGFLLTSPASIVCSRRTCAKGDRVVASRPLGVRCGGGADAPPAPPLVGAGPAVGQDGRRAVPRVCTAVHGGRKFVIHSCGASSARRCLCDPRSSSCLASRARDTIPVTCNRSTFALPLFGFGRLPGGVVSPAGGAKPRR